MNTVLLAIDVYVIFVVFVVVVVVIVILSINYNNSGAVLQGSDRGKTLRKIIGWC